MFLYNSSDISSYHRFKPCSGAQTNLYIRALLALEADSNEYCKNCLPGSGNYNHSSSPCLRLQILCQGGSLTVRDGSGVCKKSHPSNFGSILYFSYQVSLFPWPLPSTSSYTDTSSRSHPINQVISVAHLNF